MKESKVVFLHFSFRRPTDASYGLFATALYADKEGKNLVAHKTKAIELWENQQYVTAIQSYEYALSCISEWEHDLKLRDVTNVALVSSNTTLRKWIKNPKKNTNYEKYMYDASQKYKVGGTKEIKLAVGLAEKDIKEKSYKYCREDLVCNRQELKGYKNVNTKLDIKIEKTIHEILSEEEPNGLDLLEEVVE